MGSFQVFGRALNNYLDILLVPWNSEYFYWNLSQHRVILLVRTLLRVLLVKSLWRLLFVKSLLKGLLVRSLLRGLLVKSLWIVILFKSLWRGLLFKSLRRVLLVRSLRRVLLVKSLWRVLLGNSLWGVLLGPPMLKAGVLLPKESFSTKITGNFLNSDFRTRLITHFQQRNAGLKKSKSVFIKTHTLKINQGYFGTYTCL